ncbi:MAG: leucine-rich repeat domain-containing protein [Bacillota bacterium]|nr:leucine-rich repeat domain-containing protein [Bacillota bacterium]MDW7682780.1 leucine-rich repeat domain-containing protein [Bacillota bacterium]
MPGKSLIAAVVILFLISISAPVFGETSVRFSDAGLEDAVRRTLREWNKPLTRADLARLSVLEAPSAGISNLSGLEHAINLVKLDLSGNLISDLTPLAGLTGLQSLNLKWNGISSVSPLRNLSGLTYLGLENNKISDISPLSGLTQLTRLNLGKNNIRDISALRSLTRQQQLIIYFNQISDISALSGLTELRVLNLSDNKIADIAALVKNLEHGGLAGAYINLEHNRLSPDNTALNKLRKAGITVVVGSRSPGSTPTDSTDMIPDPVEIRRPRSARQNSRTPPAPQEVQADPDELPTDSWVIELRQMQFLLVLSLLLAMAIVYVIIKIVSILIKQNDLKRDIHL